MPPGRAPLGRGRVDAHPDRRIGSVPVPLHDVHAHLTHPRLSGELDAILERARNAGVTTIVSQGLNVADNQAVLQLAARSPVIRPALGLYPVDAVLLEMQRNGEDPFDSEPALPAEESIAWVRANLHQAFAIGEVGLDGHWVPERYWADQERSFRALVKLAHTADIPVIVHTRRREERALEILDELGPRRVDWHCFGGRLALAQKIASRGHFFSIPANARRSSAFTGMLTKLPRHQLLLETDCPYLGPERGQPNEPANVRVTVALAAELWNEPIEEVEGLFADNFRRFCGEIP